MEQDTQDSLLSQSRRNGAERLTVELPAGTLTALKIHAARRERTIREIVTKLVESEIKGEAQ